MSPSDLDLVMSDGLGLRYAFMGPLETMHLNAEGRLWSTGARVGILCYPLFSRVCKQSNVTFSYN